MINHEIKLNYSLSPGWMAPFIDGLQQGHAMAMQCTDCQRVTYPPERVCSCGAIEQCWIKLAGTVELVYHCDGLDGQYALVQFQGADTLSVAKLEGFDSSLSSESKILGVMHPVRNELPALVVRPE